MNDERMMIGFIIAFTFIEIIFYVEACEITSSLLKETAIVSVGWRTPIRLVI